MKHPIVSEWSLTPIVCTFVSVSGNNTRNIYSCEKAAAKFWQNSNLLNTEDLRPVDDILFRVLPSVSAESVSTIEGERFVFEGRIYLTRDIKILSRLVQWLCSSLGDDLLSPMLLPKDVTLEREYWAKFKRLEGRYSVIKHLIHECSNKCVPSISGGMKCVIDPEYVKKRDTLIVKAFMLWLGQPNGRAYLEKMEKYLSLHASSERPEYESLYV